MKKIGLILAVAVLGFTVNAQKNVTKITVSPGLIGDKDFSNLTLEPTVYNFLFGIAQERALNSRLSIQTAFKFSKKDIDISDFSSASYADTSYNPFNNSTFSSWTNVTELRIYGKDKVLKGFYFGPYLNYASRKVNTDPDFVSFTDEFGEVFFGDVQQIIGLSNIGLGFQIGTQKVWDGGMVLDWTILGVGFNSYKASLKYDVTNTSGNFDFRDYTTDIEKAVLDIEEFGADVKYDVQKESVEASISRPFVHFRMALSIGFAYGGGKSKNKGDNSSF